MEVTATGVKRQQNSIVYACPANPVQHVVFFQGDAQNFREKMFYQEETSPWTQWCLENTCSLLQKKFPHSAIWIIRPSRMLRFLFSCFHNFVQSSLIGVPTYNSTYGCLPQLERLLKDAIQRVIRRGDLVMDVRSALELPIVLIGFSRGCVVLNQIIHELINYIIPDSPRRSYGHSLYRSRQVNYSQSTPSIPSEATSYNNLSTRSDRTFYTRHGQRSQPSSPTPQRRFDRPSSSDLPSRSDRIASPDVPRRTKRMASPEVSRRQSKRLASADDPPQGEQSDVSLNELFPSPEMSHRHERLASPDVLHLPERASPEIPRRTDRLASPEVQQRIYSETSSRSRLSSTSSTKSTKSECGYTPEPAPATFQPIRSYSFGASASKHIITLSEDDIRNLTVFLRRIKAFYWLDAGHSGGHGAWVTDSELLSMLASLGADIFVHVTPQQICDPHRLWIGEEEKEFVDKLRSFGGSVHERIHFEHEERSLERHFGVLDEF